MKKHYDSFDFLKGICCLAVCFIHFNWRGNIGIVVKAICRFAVPIFFFISGFFFVSDKNTIDRKRTFKKIKHILWLTIKFAAFYAIFCIIYNKIYNNNWDMLKYADKVTTKTGLVKLILTNDPFVYAHLWYLLALIYCYGTFLIFKEKKISKNIVYFAALLFIAYYFFVHQHDYRTIKNFIMIGKTKHWLVINNFYFFRALPFFMFGMYAKVREKEIKKFKISKIAMFMLVIFGFLISVDEKFKMGESGYYIGSVLIMIVTCLKCIQCPTYKGRFIGKVLYFIGKNLSLYVYIFHIAVGRLFEILASRKNLWTVDWYMNTRAFIIILTTLIVSLIIFYSKKILIKMLNKMFKKESHA